MDKLVWIDLEMTGLDPLTHKIIEVACIITDSENFYPLADPFNVQIHVSDEELAKMDEWNVSHHGGSGLTKKVRESKISLEQAEEMLLAYLKKHEVLENVSPLCGNAIHTDSFFMKIHMPKVRNYLHYRIIDVSSIKEIARRWYPHVFVYKKKESHVAIDDIKESIEELKYYRTRIFK